MSISLQAPPHLHWESDSSDDFNPDAYSSSSLTVDSRISPVHVNDSYINEDSSKVIILCKGKSVVVDAILSKPVTIHGTSNWSSFLKQALGPLGSLLNFADLVAQFNGDTLKQPFFSRKVWEGSEPLRFDIELDLIAVSQSLLDTNNKDVDIFSGSAAFLEVYRPACGIMSLLYPGWQMSGSSLDPSTMQIPGPNAFGDIDFKAYSNDYSATTQTGQSFYLSIGSFLLFTACLATQCSVTFGTQLDRWGYPMQAKVALTVETYEAPFVELDSPKESLQLPFAFNRISVTNQSAKSALTSVVSGFGKVSEQFAKSMPDMYNYFKGLVGVLLDTDNGTGTGAST